MHRLISLAFSLSLSLYFLFYAFESIVRYGFHLLGHDNLIFVRDIILAFPLMLIFIEQFLRRKVHPAYYIYLFVVGAHGFIMMANTGSYVAVGYTAKMLITVLAGAVAAPRLCQPKRAVLLFFFVLWVATGVGVVLDKYVVEFPWANMSTTIGDMNVDISRDWQLEGENKRAGGFTRSSIHAASLDVVLALTLLMHLRFRLLGWLIAALTLPVLYCTTQKGALAAFLLTLGFIFLAPRRPVAWLKVGFFMALVMAIALPLILPEYHMPNATGNFSMMSFYMRVEDTWPRAWTWINHNEAFPFGVGLGGISGAQRFFAPFQVDYADNIFIILYAYFGVMTFAYLAWVAVTVARQKNDGKKSVGHAMAILVFLMFYGCVLTIIEDQMLSMFLGGALAWLAHEVKSRRAGVPEPEPVRSFSELASPRPMA